MSAGGRLRDFEVVLMVEQWARAHELHLQLLRVLQQAQAGTGIINATRRRAAMHLLFPASGLIAGNR